MNLITGGLVMLNNKEAVLFDLDGTLVDSMWMWRDIDEEFLTQRGIALPEDLQSAIEGMSFTETAVYFKEHFGLTESVDELKNIWNAMAMDKYKHSVPYKDGAREFLKYLKENSIKTGIATSNSPELVDAVLTALDMKNYIDVIVTACSVEHGKPWPDVYLKAAELLEVAPDKCLVFEDISAGIMAGKKAGMEVCAIWDEYSNDQDDEKRAFADYYVKSYNEIKRG